MERLTSMKNPRIVSWRALKEHKGRVSSGCFLAEGRKMTAEALDSGFPVEAVLLREEEALPMDLPASVPLYLLPSHVFDSVCETRTPQGIAAVVRIQPRPASGPRLIALDQVQDPGNVGTILRTADAAGFTGALLAPGCADVFSPKTLRATMGSIFRLGLSFPDSLPDALSALRSDGWSILSTQLDGDPFYQRKNVSDQFVLIIGNEGNGVSPEVQAQATHRMRLPMRGGAESLNAAVAAGIMMYDLTRGLEET